MRIRNEDKVQLVKQTAMEMIVSGGLESFSVNKLAKACGISVATLYIYYKDKDDLITKIGMEEGERMAHITLDGFDPEMSFAEGLRLQWKNRAKHIMGNKLAVSFFEQLRGSSTYHDKVTQSIFKEFKDKMGMFINNAVSRGEIAEVPVEVYWSVAFAPLYSLLRFHNEGKSIGGKPFKLSETILSQTFELVLKAFRP